MDYTIRAFIYRSDTHYVARCDNINVVTQGKTVDETIANLNEAVSLFLEGEDPSELGLSPDPPILLTLELPPPTLNAG